MNTGIGKVEKLRGADNWQEWRFVICTLLENNDILQVCNGAFVKPVLNMGFSFSPPVDCERLVTWKKKNNAAKCLIITNLESKPLQLIMDCDTAKDMWKKLHSVFDVELDESLSLIQKEFFKYHWNPTENVAQHVLRLEQMVSKMKALGGEIKEEEEKCERKREEEEKEEEGKKKDSSKREKENESRREEERKGNMEEVEAESSRRYTHMLELLSRMAHETQTCTTTSDQLLCYVKTILENQKKVEALLHTLLNFIKTVR